MSSLQSLDIELRSATTTRSPIPQAPAAGGQAHRRVDSCIGCKACQVACMQWNDLRDEVGIETTGHLRQPGRPHARLLDGDEASPRSQPEERASSNG